MPSWMLQDMDENFNISFKALVPDLLNVRRFARFGTNCAT